MSAGDRQPRAARHGGRFLGVASTLVALVALAGCTGSGAQPAAAPTSAVSVAPSATPLLPTAVSPEDRAADEALARTLDTELAKPAYKDLRSMIVLAHGRTVYERYFSSLPEDRHQLWSVTKSVIGTLVGIASYRTTPTR